MERGDEHDLADYPHSTRHRCASDLALQRGLGLLPIERSRHRARHPDRACPNGKSVNRGPAAQIFPQRGLGREERDAPLQAGHGQKRARRTRREGQKSKTGHRDRPLEGSQKGQESPCQKEMIGRPPPAQVARSLITRSKING